MLKPCLNPRTHPDFHLTPPPFQRCRIKIKHVFVCLPCACGRFIHFIFISFRRSVHSASLQSLHYPSLHSAFVHFTHLSTPRKSSSFLRSKNTLASFRFAVRSALPLCTAVGLRQIYSTMPPTAEPKQLHFTLCISFLLVSRYPCLCQPAL